MATEGSITAKSLDYADFVVTFNGTDYSQSALGSIDYTGSAIIPEVNSASGSLVTATDYTVSYGTNMAVGTSAGTITITGTGNFTGTLEYTFDIIDRVAPTGTITVGTNSWNSFWNTVTFGLFFNKTQKVTVEATDGESGVAKMEYYLAEAAVESTQALAQAEWTAFTGGTFNIDPNNKYVVYVKITDHSGNSTIINSDGIVLESVVPVISGITNGAVYCESVSFTVTDDNYDYVTVDGEKVDGTAVQDASGSGTGSDSESGDSGSAGTTDGSESGTAAVTTYSFTLTADNKEHTIVAYDKAGNTAAVTVTVNDGHTYVYTSDDNTDTITESCMYSEYSASVTLTAPSGTHVYDGTSHDAALSYIDTLSGGNSLAITYTYSTEEDGTKEATTSTIAAGYYTASVTCGGETVSVDYKVAKATVDAPTIEDVVYTGSTLNANVTESPLYTLTMNEGGTDAGSYDVVLTLTDTVNYEWASGNGTVSSDGKSVTLSFTITETEIEIGTETEPETETQTATEIKTETETEAQTEPEIETETETEAQTETETENETETETESKTETEAENETATAIETKTESEEANEAETDSENKSANTTVTSHTKTSDVDAMWLLITFACALCGAAACVEAYKRKRIR